LYKLINWNQSLDLEEFYKEAGQRGFENNSSQKKMIDCFQNEREWKVWVLYQNNKAVGSVAAHSFDDMFPNGYRICARTCSFAEARPSNSMITVNRLIKEHQNLTAQFFIPACIEWAGYDKDLYITSTNSTLASQRLVHTIYFPTLAKIGTVDKIGDIFYRNTNQTAWKLNVNTFLKQLSLYPRWNLTGESND